MEFLLNIQKPFTQINDMLFRNMERDPCVYLDQDEFEEAEHLFAKMNDEFQHHRTWKETLLHTLIFQALVFYDRKHAEKETLLSAAHLDRKETTALSIIEYINANLEKDITIHDAAKHASVGEAGLNKLLKETLSVNFSEILQEARLRKASALLKTTLFSIDEVAAASGYRNTNTFEKVFKMTKGMPPEQFRRSNLYTEYVHTIIKNLPDSEALFQQISPDLKNVSYADIHYAQVRLYLYQHFSEDITLKKLTKVFHYNESYLSEILAAYHASFNDILREARIHHASTLLRTTPIPAVDIGFAVGFNSRETFMRAFKSLKGVSPGAFRKATPGGAISAGKPLPKP
jgi:AraC-like DNA-binding protein